jgi:hypothetical protein
MYLLCALLPLGKTPAPAPDDPSNLDAKLDEIAAAALQNAKQRVQEFLRQPLTAERTFAFEQQLLQDQREANRQLLQAVYNAAEPAPAALPKHVHFEASQYTRLPRKTPQNVWTLCGQIRLWRVGYRPTDKTAEPTLFPLTHVLGLMHGASPALAERAAAHASDSGMTQQRVLAQLRQEYGVHWGVKKLRQVTALLSAAMTEQRQEVQVQRLLDLLQQADTARGRHKPVLSVGRDGITLGMRGLYGGSLHEVATCSTVTVLDRRGKRLGTVYLAYVPEYGQGTMTKQLTALLTAVFQRWQGALPRLSYVTDSGDHETAYYDQVLRRLKHPRTGERLAWIRVADYYHVSERLWTMAEQLYGKGRRATAWARKMQRWLLQPNGAYRVLHSAAALRAQQNLRGQRLTKFERAYRYVRERLAYERYAAYRKLGIPLGSGVTEAGCKTVYTQRLKLSGMRWTREGAQRILSLRVLRLSGVWDQAYQRVLQAMQQPKVRTQAAKAKPRPKNAA